MGGRAAQEAQAEGLESGGRERVNAARSRVAEEVEVMKMLLSMAKAREMNWRKGGGGC